MTALKKRDPFPDRVDYNLEMSGKKHAFFLFSLYHRATITNHKQTYITNQHKKQNSKTAAAVAAAVLNNTESPVQVPRATAGRCATRTAQHDGDLEARRQEIAAERGAGTGLPFVRSTYVVGRKALSISSSSRRELYSRARG